jgi:H+/Cl- antiporter ClcA
VIFQLGINVVYQMGLGHLASGSKITFALGSLAVVTISSLVVGWLMHQFGRDAAGSGIPQLKLAFWKDFGFVPWRVAGLKFIAGILSVGGGASLGREGPSVQIAGTLASNIAGLAGEAKQNRRAAAAAGAAAGLAAAFNAPLAATTFVLEEIIGDLNSRLLGSGRPGSNLARIFVDAGGGGTRRLGRSLFSAVVDEPAAADEGAGEGSPMAGAPLWRIDHLGPGGERVLAHRPPWGFQFGV